MELYQLRSFSAVAELGHLTRAAERLHVSQPALSAQIKALEDELSVVLFDRGATGMTLTAAGRQLLPEAERVISAAQAMKSEALALRGEVTGRIRLGTVADPEFIRLTEVLGRAVERFPLLEIEAHHEVTGVAFEKIRDGELDVAYYYGNLAHPAITSLVLREFAYRVVAPVAWKDRLAGAPWEAIALEPWIMAPPVSTHYALATELFNTHGAAPLRCIEADQEPVISSLVVAGMGFALMREDLAAAYVDARQVFIWGSARLLTRLQFMFRRERERDPAIQAIRDVVSGVWNVPSAAARLRSASAVVTA